MGLDGLHGGAQVRDLPEGDVLEVDMGEFQHGIVADGGEGEVLEFERGELREGVVLKSCEFRVVRDLDEFHRG